jgi:type IV pilus assembly protein PilN
VILINLLPHREAARKKRKEAFNVGLGASALAGGLLAGLIFLLFQAQISNQQYLNQTLKNEITRFDNQIQEIAGLEAEITALRARQQAVEDLQSDRNMPVHLLVELVRQLPDGVYINSMRQSGNGVALQGVAQSNERISELLRNLGTNSRWFGKPNLIEIVAGSVTLSPRDIRRVANFKINVQLIRSEKAKEGVTAAVKPAKSASAASQPAAK